MITTSTLSWCCRGQVTVNKGGRLKPQLLGTLGTFLAVLRWTSMWQAPCLVERAFLVWAILTLILYIIPMAQRLPMAPNGPTSATSFPFLALIWPRPQPRPLFRSLPQPLFRPLRTSSDLITSFWIVTSAIMSEKTLEMRAVAFISPQVVTSRYNFWVRWCAEFSHLCPE